jgi:hypothetical protein
MRFATGMALSFLMSLAVGCAGQSESDSVVLDRIDDQIEDELDWVEDDEDREAIELLARSGEVNIHRNSDRCFGEQTDDLGRGKDGQALCVKQVKLPREALAEVKLGNEYRFENVSDYDQRVTRLYAFEHNGLLDRFIGDEDLAALTKAFGIPQIAGEPRVKVTTPDDYGHLGILDYSMYVGVDYAEETAMLNFSRAFLGEAEAKTFRFGSGVELYPGGGFTTDFAIIVTAEKLLYVKVEGWNS